MYCLRPVLFFQDGVGRKSRGAALTALFTGGLVVVALSSCAAQPVMKAEVSGAPLLSGQTADQGAANSDESTAKNANDSGDRVTLAEIAAVARKVDGGYEDGWISGREPRVFKSPYGKLSAEDKAAFALAYHNFIEGFPQDLANDRSTYVPYSKRSAFARNYWESSALAKKFKGEQEKYQVAWIHESLLDGSELWWRAAEIRFGARINSASTLSHDTEQNMVFKYMEDQNTESTFALQLKPKK